MAMSKCGQHERETVESLGPGRRQVQHRAVLREGLGRSALLLEGIRQIEMSQGVLRLQSESYDEMFDRFGEMLLLSQQNSPVELSRGIGRPQAGSFRIVGDGLRGLAQVGQLQ